MKTISIANRKGGVGKTSMAVNLSYELKFLGFKVVMMDLDCQCDLTKVYQPDAAGPNILDVLQKKCRIADALIEVEENLYLIPGSRYISQYNFTGSEQALLRFTKYFDKKGFDFVILDHPPSLHDVALAGYVASDEVLLVCQAESFSVQDMDQLLEDLNVIKETFNHPELHVLGIAMNRIDNRRKLTNTILNKCRSVFRKNILQNTISNDTAIPNSLHKNLPVRNLHWRSRTVSQFNNMATELLERMGINNES